MYSISKTTQFKKDYKLIKRRGYDMGKLTKVFTLLATGEKLPAKYKEHPLRMNYKNHIDCHIEPDWLLIFMRNNAEKQITLVRTGTHSDLFKQ